MLPGWADDPQHAVQAAAAEGLNERRNADSAQAQRTGLRSARPDQVFTFATRTTASPPNTASGAQVNSAAC